MSYFEVWVYEIDEIVSEDFEESNMYVYYDIMLLVFFLCFLWLDCNFIGEGKGNYVVVGMM